MSNAQGEGGEVMEYVWIAEHSVRRRKRKLFEADERRRSRYGWKPQAHFDTEVEARAHMVQQAIAEVAKYKKMLKAAERLLKQKRADLEMRGEAKP